MNLVLSHFPSSDVPVHRWKRRVISRSSLQLQDIVFSAGDSLQNKSNTSSYGAAGFQVAKRDPTCHPPPTLLGSPEQSGAVYGCEQQHPVPGNLSAPFSSDPEVPPWSDGILDVKMENYNRLVQSIKPLC